MRLVHAADIHLDSPLNGLTRLRDSQLTETLRSATRRALENLVQLVVDQDARILLLAGDVYDGDWHNYGTGEFFVHQMARLHDEGVQVFMVAGNHDAESQITRALRLPPNVTVLDTARPQTVLVPDLGLAVHGQGFATKAVTENLAASYPVRAPGLINIGLLHTSVDGAPGHAPYAPCRLSDLTGLGYDYFALGHVHEHRMLSEGQFTVAYSGNLQGRNPRETGVKGALVVDVAAGEGAQARLVPLDVARWAALRIDVDGIVDLDEVLNRVETVLRDATTAAQGRPLVARLLIEGHSPAARDLADPERIRADLSVITARLDVTVEKITVRVEPPSRPDRVDQELSSAMVEAAARLVDDPDAVREVLRGLDNEVGVLLREAGLLDLRKPADLRGIAQSAATGLRSLLDGGRD